MFDGWPISFMGNDFTPGGGGGYEGPPFIVTATALDNRGGSNTPLTVEYPAGLMAGDIAFIHVLSLSALGTAHTIDTPSGGWAEISQQQLATIGYYRQAVFWLRLTGSESGSVTVTRSGSNPPISDTLAGVMSIWRGAKVAGTPYESVGNNTALSANMAGSSVTTSVDNCVILNFCGCDDDTLSTEASGWDEEYDYVSALAVDHGMKLYSILKATAGTLAAATHTLAASERWQVISLSLIPENP